MNRRRRTGSRTEVLSVLILYALLFIGSLALAGDFLGREPARRSPGDYVGVALLALVPLAVIAVLVARWRALALDSARRAYGSRLRVRLTVLFLGVAALAFIPTAVFLGSLLAFSMEAPASENIAIAVERARLRTFAEDQERLGRIERLMLLDAPRLAARWNYEAPRLLDELAAREPTIIGAGVYAADGRELGWAERTSADLQGPRSTREERERAAASMSGSGFLARETAGGRTRVRFRVVLDAALGLSAVALSETERALEESAEALEIAGAEIAALRSRRDSFPFELAWFMAAFVLPGALLALLVGVSAADSMTGPLEALDEAMRRAGEGDLTPRLMTKPGDEIASLLAAFNRMLVAVARSRDETAASGKASAWREIARSLAHELKNPLTPIKLSAERVLRRWRNEPSSIGEILENSMMAVIKEVESMNALLAEFRDFARLPVPEPAWIDLASLVEEAVSPYRASYPGVSFDASAVPRDLVLPVDRSQLRRAISNLVQNSVDAMDGRGEISFRADLVKAADNRYCRLRVRDSGRGVSAAIRDRIFEPYVSDKPEGTGLGLAIVDRILRDHGGRISLESAEGAGAVFTIDLPMDRSLST
ncbi:MAG: HAMP domain-containing protein [Spirochaetales bacterium]|nr:HAMP domain-containing protein [Spirochaetales bacterium]